MKTITLELNGKPDGVEVGAEVSLSHNGRTVEGTITKFYYTNGSWYMDVEYEPHIQAMQA